MYLLFLSTSRLRHPSWVTRIEHREDVVGLVNDIVQHAVAVSVLLFLRLVGSYRRGVTRAASDEMSLADADSGSAS